MGRVRLGLIPPLELSTTVRPDGLVSAEALLDAAMVHGGGVVRAVHLKIARGPLIDSLPPRVSLF